MENSSQGETDVENSFDSKMGGRFNMDIAEKIEDAKQSDALLLIVFYTDWSPHYEWIEPLLHEFETPVNIIRVNMEGDKKVADAYNIETAPGFVLQRKDRILWKKTGEVFP